MCGIFSLLNTDENYIISKKNIIEQQFYKGVRRGPEFSKIQYLSDFKTTIGFHRLAINGLNNESNQPIVYNGITLICNGEIYNYKNLYKFMNITPVTNSDCEVVIHLYIRYGIEQTLVMLDGVYAFVLYDFRVNDLNSVYIARDPFGLRSLYNLTLITDNNSHNIYGFASELKCLEYFYNEDNKNVVKKRITQFTPGSYSMFEMKDGIWNLKIGNNPYFIPSFPHTKLVFSIYEFTEDMLKNISSYLNTAVIKRCNTTERPVACLLSGGLDSSLIAALVANYFDKKGKQIETYSIGLENSEDIKYAKIVANYIGSKHTEVILTEEEFFNAIPEVIQAIESYDTTTVRASIGNYLIGKYISEHSDAKVIFNGDGSDELFGGYLYMHKCPDDIEFDKETRRLLKDIHLFDVLRSDKSISSNGLEPRTPFLDRNFVNYILSIPAYFRNHNNFEESEKYLLRKSFNGSNFYGNNGKSILPESILLRKKEAFSDGVSNQRRSLFLILQEHIANYYNTNGTKYEKCIELEQKYYKDMFNKVFPNCSHIIPYYWLPKYIYSNDPSARTLEIYNNAG